MSYEIRLGRKKLYVLPDGKGNLEVLVDCNETGGMMRIPITPAQFERWQQPREQREMIQDIFPELSAELREVLISGNTPAEWNQIFGKKKYSIKDLKSKFNYEFES